MRSGIGDRVALTARELEIQTRLKMADFKERLAQCRRDVCQISQALKIKS